MRIIIVGAGQVGMHLATHLSWQGHEVSLIDTDESRINQIESQLEVLAVHGSGTSASTLVRAKARNADMLIAVTSIDEVNIVSCLLAANIGVKTRIARIRNREYSSSETPVPLAELGIQQIINPELEAAKAVLRMIRYPHATDVFELGDGKLLLMGIKIPSDAPMAVRKLKDVPEKFRDIVFRFVAIYRDGKTIVPKGDDLILPKDVVYVITAPENANRIFELTGKHEADLTDVMLLGGGRIGRYVASALEHERHYNIKLIENGQEQSQQAAAQLSQTMVVRGGDNIDIDLLTIEGLGEMGIFAALSPDDENNIVSSLFARHLKVPKTITLVNKPEYQAIIRAIGLEAAVNERILTSDAILKHLHDGRIVSVSSLKGINAEIYEYVVRADCKVADKQLQDIVFPNGSIMGAILRNDEIAVAVGTSKLTVGDRVVVFCLPNAQSKVDKLFK